MDDAFRDRAADYDQQPVPAQISRGVSAALLRAVTLRPDMTVIDFGAGTGLLAGHVAPHVGRLVAVDVSPSMLAQLQAKPEFAGRVEVRCHDLTTSPLDVRADLIVSAMAMHHVQDTDGLLRALRDHLAPGGTIALADLDAEDGTFHPPGLDDVFHLGFDRAALGHRLAAAGFQDVRFETACEVSRDGRSYPIFLVTAARGDA